MNISPEVFSETGSFDTRLDSETAIGIYQIMRRIAETDQSIQRQLAAGELQFQYYPCGGQEAIPAAIAPLLSPDDRAVITYRCIHDIVAKGTPIKSIVAEMFGKATGTCGGKGGPMHLSDPANGLMATTGIVGAGAPIANGIALAKQLAGSGQIVICSFGDGAANIGAVHEALNLAGLWNLPVVFVCQNNLYAEYTSFEESTAARTIAERGPSYGIVGHRVDGTSPEEIYEAAQTAITRARAGEGPTLLECVAPRLQGHAFGSDEAHMDAEMLAAGRADPPIAKYRRQLIDSFGVDPTLLDAIDAEAKTEVQDALEFAKAAPFPTEEQLIRDVFAPGEKPVIESLPSRPIEVGCDAAFTSMPYAGAINAALDHALTHDDKVVVLGEDIADPAGGVAKATIGLSTKHGAERVRNTPISEQAIVGAAIGAAMEGLRPVAEIMLADFAMVCMDQIANHAAKLRYMSGGKTTVPLTIRMLTAGNIGSFGAQHSQSLEAWFAHIPGLKIALPATPADAKGLLLSAINDPDPCIVIESMRCYFTPGDVPDGDYRVPLGVAKVVREGTDATVISYGWALHEVLAAAGELADAGIEIEVVDLRSIVPLDMATVSASVAKTGRAMIVHGAVEFGGIGAEIAARLAENHGAELKAPVARLGSAYTPVPFAQNLEAAHFPDPSSIVERLKSLIGGADGES
ncbi:dehydrogenase E1 component subunit alpha/beta [Altererythrobacter arenosus]|uniref:2-oxoglutarate dehydrogenase E1 component n=1 Tax=Altererythrobacter arenosus TaxID=3032592 RepID=A0ABY8FRU9_9SPHN|nr:dehydrogenase E1 component subunit alpha/beta [Altererythrobacter sp. CAU 1644]WFL77739.1 dehydrogenase E1 component subunit alpha/beta [Altererythrobacter sp. CAU 1644]